mmetsp:Transcript_5679/g.7986  ORF Transcript_5679/g.7986 Transcript_5679/m.7986 type:complete len:334 (-) Transcript_5679:1034-2035(-)|eukprot:CAMPEP_0194032418 /NCGR_PEP_ID=MMETSP0009_2-20130614/5360_1 /TAXON_ID=210454 /ORGANISM="Grammatophora oceanica, Strain CCMP 410" /LENGTH=333 /DNA_ID=CAMNT_0038672859 /DNA_START=116 /DNA_END=1117 /DNA_ORIENTATION=-
MGTRSNDIVAPSSGVFYRNKRQKKIHVRFHFPTATRDVRGLLFFSHGLHAHVNRAWSYVRFFDQLKEKGFAVVAHDNEGNGYSEASGPRGYFDDVSLVVDDYQDIVEIVRSGNPSIFDLAFGKGLIAPDMVAKLAKVKYCLMGMSMGGLTTQLCFQRMLAVGKDVPSGLVYFCPVLHVKPLPFHSVTVEVVRFATMCCRIGMWEIPDVVTGRDPNDATSFCATPEGRRKINADYTEEGLASKCKLRWGQALAIFDGAAQVDIASLKLTKVLLFHDPEDKLVPFSNAELAVKHGGSSVRLKLCPNQGHVLMHGRDEDVVSAVTMVDEWFSTAIT